MSEMCTQRSLKEACSSRNLIKVFVVRMEKRCIHGYPECAWNEQANLNLRLTHIPEVLLLTLRYSKNHTFQFDSIPFRILVIPN